MLKRLFFILLLIIQFNFLLAEFKITAMDGAEDDRLGQSVVLEDGWIFVGANRDYQYNVNSGSVYVYTIDENSDTEFYTKINPEDLTNDQYFGKSIAYNNSWLAVSAIYDNDNGIKSGAVYLYYFNGIDWIEHSKIIAYDGEQYDRFGYSIDIYSNKLIVGSIYDDDQGEDSGSAYLYEYNNEEWTLLSKICPNLLVNLYIHVSFIFCKDEDLLF